MCMYRCIDMYIHTYIHRYIDTYMHIYMWSWVARGRRRKRGFNHNSWRARDWAWRFIHIQGVCVYTARVCACTRARAHVRTCTPTRSLHECVCSARAVCARARAFTCVCAYMLYIDDAHRHTPGRLRQIKSCCRCCLGLVINVPGSSSLPQRQPNLNSTAENRVGPVGLSSAL